MKTPKQLPENTSYASQNFSLLVVWFALFCDYCLLTLAVPIFPQLEKSEFETGVLFAMKAMTQILSSPMVARHVDAYNLEPLLLGLFVEALSTVTFAFTKSYPAWCFARAISGISSSCIISSGFLHVQRRFANDPEGMGRSMSLVATGIIMGVTFGPPLGGLLYGVSEPLPFLFLICLICLCALLTYMLSLRLPPDIASKADAVQETNEEFKSKLKKLLLDPNITITLLSLFCANAAISCLEATFGLYMDKQFGFTVEQIGMLYVIGAVPSVIGSKIAGDLGNKHGRWKVVWAGMVMQGSFYALGPKDSFPIEIISLIGLGLGMGLVDGCAPALLAQRAGSHHDGTGIVYTLNTMAVQGGFVFGPLVGSAIMQSMGFGRMSAVLGLAMVAVSPLMAVNKNMPLPSEEGVEFTKIGEGEDIDDEL
mmetsp:Transcript_15243/g.28444  ORF Transcript_15243/g.28444 Transcript_15243/m.28444 type:complete len:424 (-) Transcript_15243:63-1334(-)